MSLSNIEHIVFLMLENRSFDHMLGYLSREDTPDPLPVEGLHADDAWKDAWANYESAGQSYRIEKFAPGTKIEDPPHGYERVKQQIDTPPGIPGPPRMGGFVKTYVDAWLQGDNRRPANAGAVMSYYDGDGVWAYDFLARNYCVCDHWFTPLPAGTQPNRLMGMGGDTRIARNRRLIPKHDLVYNWLKRSRVGWSVYRWGGSLPFFALMARWWDNILGSLVHRGRFRDFDRLRTDWTSGTVPPVVFIEPAYSELRGDKANDDHAPTRITGGQVLVADIYDILTSNEERWAKTLLVITYDEHGGFFDHVPPLPIRKEVEGHMFETTGPRVPALLVSPFVAPGRVFSEPVDHTAFLAMLAEKFTPSVPYSPAVDERQSSLPGFGKLSSALTGTARAGTPPVLTRPLGERLVAGFQAVTGLEIPGLTAEDDAPDAGTETAIAFDIAARKTAAKRPDLLADPDWQGLRHYVETTEPPVPRHEDHIGAE